MSSASGIRARRARDRPTRDPGEGHLARIVATVFRLGQASPLRSLCAVVGLGLSLQVRHDPTRFLVAGGAGLVLLSLVLFREPATRIIFAASGLLLLALYAWAGTESVELAVVLDGDRLIATVGEVTVSSAARAERRVAGRGPAHLERPRVQPGIRRQRARASRSRR